MKRPAMMRTSLLRIELRNARRVDTTPPSPGHESRMMAQVRRGDFDPVIIVCDESNLLRVTSWYAPPAISIRRLDYMAMMDVILDLTVRKGVD